MTSAASLNHKVQISFLNAKFKQIFNSVVRFQITLPFEVSHTVIQTSKMSILKFMVVSHSTEPFRIVSYKISHGSHQALICSDQVLFLGQEFSILASPLSTEEKRDFQNEINLDIAFRPIADEVKHYVYHRIIHHLSEANLLSFNSFFKKQYMEGPLSSFDVISYAMFGVLKLASLDLSKWDNFLESEDNLTALKSIALKLDYVFLFLL